MYKNIFKKIFSKFFLVVFVLSNFFSIILPQATFAQSRGSAANTAATANTGSTAVRGGVSTPADPTKKLFSEVSGQCTNLGRGQLFYKCSDGTYYNCAGSGRNSNMCSQTNQLEAEGEKSCSIFWSSFSELFVCAVETVASWILQGINWMLRGLITLASFIFDFTVYTTVVKFKQNFADLKLNISGNTVSYTNLGGAIFGSDGDKLVYYLWGIIRDMLNVMIFLIIIYNAVQSMFEGFESTRKKFVALLVFSIVVNFSLLFVKLAIDVSNILALQAYTLAVKPAGTSDFTQFRTAASTGQSKSYGEYIMNSIDLNEILKKQIGIDINQTEAAAGIQSTFMFQLGRMLVYVGIIYILLFMSGVLIARAVNFLMAMILAPLIAADIFFATIGKNAGSETQALVEKIRSKTKTIKGDFYEALVKGPLLIFLIFLIGVFADSIVGSGIVNEISRSAGSLPDMKNLDGTFTKSLFVFFKFAIFFALCQILFSKLNEISSFGGSGMMSKWGSKFANFTLGRGMNAVGWTGRNTIGRATNKLGLNTTFSKMAANATKELENKNIGFFSKNFQQAKLSFAQRGLKTNKNLVEGSYDLRAPLGKGGLGNLIKGATGVDASKDFGKAETRGFEKIQEEKAAARKKTEDDRTAEIAGFIKATESEVMAKKAKVGGQEVTLEQMKELLKNGKDSGVEDGDNIKFNLKGGAVSFKKDAVTDLFKEENPNGIDAIYHKEKEAAEKKISDENKKKFEKSRRMQIAEGNSRTLGDYLSVDRIMARQGMEEKAKEDHLTHERKSAKEKAEKAKQQKNFIDGTLTQMTDNIFNQITKIKKIFPGVDIISPDDENLKVLNSFLIESEEFDIKTEEGKKKFEAFNKEGKDKLFKAKEEILTKLRKHLNNNTTTANRTQLQPVKKVINDAIERNKKNKENYEATITDKKKEDVHGGDGKTKGATPTETKAETKPPEHH